MSHFGMTGDRCIPESGFPQLHIPSFRFPFSEREGMGGGGLGSSSKDES